MKQMQNTLAYLFISYTTITQKKTKKKRKQKKEEKKKKKIEQ